MSHEVAQHGLLAGIVGGPDVVRVYLGGQLLPDAAVGPLVIRHGRDETSKPPDPATCTVQLVGAQLPWLPTLGDELRVELGADAIIWAGLTDRQVADAQVRFTGRITDPTATPDLPKRPGIVQVTAVSRRAQLGRIPIGDEPWPVETDGQRAAHILAAASAATGVPIGYVDAGTVLVTALDVDAQPPAELLDALALDTGGTLAELRDGRLEWHDAEHRRRARPDVTLTADQVLSSLTASQKLAGIVNDLTVAYGPTVDGGQRPTVRVLDPVSADPVAGLGPLAASLSTQLETEADALRFARLQVGRRSRPTWQLSGLTVDLLATVAPDVAGQLLRLEFGSLVAVTGFPSSGPFTAAYLWCEGWTETVTRNSWRLDVSASDYGRNGPPPRWLDVTPPLTWGDPAVTWLDLYRYPFGPTDLQRWLDVPTRERWANTPHGPTWATYPDTPS